MILPKRAATSAKSKRHILLLLCGCLFVGACVQITGRFRRVPKSVCLSEQIWSYQDKDSPMMNPGRSCVGCHEEIDDELHAPKYKVGGTVMDSLHEGDDCRGTSQMTVVLTDADGHAHSIPTNSAGNFWLNPDVDLKMPLSAKIVDNNGNQRVKTIPVSNGDCAACHTKEGQNGAPGRLTPPHEGQMSIESKDARGEGGSSIQ